MLLIVSYINCTDKCKYCGVNGKFKNKCIYIDYRNLEYFVYYRNKVTDSTEYVA